MLAKDFATLAARFGRLERAFSAYTLSAQHFGDARGRGWHAMEGLLSATWQAWCGFCRSALLKSCMGSTTRGGTVTQPVADVTDAGRLAYIAKNISGGVNIKPGKVIAPHLEPTWGDVSLLLDTARHLKPTNLVSLEMGLLSTSRAPGDMRTVRNASAHISSHNLAAVEQLKVFYLGSSYAHPVDLLSWRDRSSSEYVYLVWVGELLSIAEDMTS